MNTQAAEQVLPLPESKEKLLSSLDSLNYGERIQYASRLGRDHKDSPKLKELIDSLLDHPKPEAPQIEVEEEFVKILPPQKTNVSKFYNEDQVAMFAAVASKTQLPLLEDSLLNSPSIMFKKLAVKAVVRQEKDDDKVYEALVGAVPKLQKKLLHACIRFRRVAVLERAFPVLRKEHGVDWVADFLHGCSPAFVELQLQDEEVHASKALNWHGIGRHHGKVIIELLRKELLAKSELETEEYKLDEVWCAWNLRIKSAAKELLVNTGLSGELLKLAFDEVPILEYVGEGWRPRRKELKPEDSVAVFPDIIRSNFSLFIAKHPEKMLELCKRAVYIEKRSKTPRLRSHLPYNFWSGKVAWRKLRSNRFEWIYAVVTDILNKSNPVSLFGDIGNASSAFDHSCFNYGGSFTSEEFWKSQYFSASQINKLFNALLDHLLKVRPSAENFASWNIVSDSSYERVVNTWHVFVRNLFEAVFGALASEYRTLDIREKILEGPAPASKAAAASFKPKRETERRRRSRVPVAGAPEPVKRKRVHKWTEEEKTAQRESIKRQKANLHAVVASLLKRQEEFLQPTVWQFKFEGDTPEAEEGRRLGDATNIYQSTHRAIQSSVSLLLYYFDHIRPILYAGLDVRDAGTRFVINNQALTLLGDLEKIRLDPRKGKEANEAALEGRSRVFAEYFQLWKTEPVINAEDLIRLTKFALPEQRFAIFELFDESTLEHIGENDSETLKSLFDAIMETKTPDSKLDYGKVYGALDKLLQDDVLSSEARDLLLPFRNLEDHKIRKEMTKASDSNNLAERNFAYETLIKATKISRSAVQMKRTLTFFRTKLKNESAENRAEGLRMVLADLTDDITHAADPIKFAYTDILLSSDCLPVWDLMLKDTLEAPDFSENEETLVAHFMSLSKASISRSAGETATNPLFEFGVEIQWKISLFKLGIKRSSKKFRIHFSDSLRPSPHSKIFPTGSEEQFVAGVVKAYNSRVLEKNPKFWDEPTVMEGLFPVLGKAWVHSPALVAHAKKVLDQMKTAPLDKDGLFILKHDNEGIQVFEKIFALHNPYKDRKGEEWYDIPVLVEYVETVLRSRQAPRVLFQWLVKNSQGKTRKERLENRSKAVFTLLSITPSAIYLRFVWRHLLKYHQNKLDEFINSQKTFRGVFYLSPKKRTSLAKTAAGRKAAWAETFGEDVLEKIKKEEEKEEELRKERAEFEDEDHEEGHEFDSDEFFIFPGTYGLHRLLPRQTNALAKQRMNQVLNDNLSLPDRTAATIRWTLLPTVTYADMVQFFNKYEKGTNALAVNIIEAALRGVMYNDEPCAPLQYLLSPKFLGSDRARVAMYCVSKCVPYMPASQMTDTLVMVLTGKRRTSLKVTAYKEIIRVLASRPTQRHMEMILHEWKRPVLHRDVRIAIVQKVVSFLTKEMGEEITWEVLKSCLTTHAKNAELEMALLGITPAEGPKTSQAHRFSSGLVNFQGLCLKPRLYEHYEALTKSKVPEKHCTTYFKEIIFPLATSALDDDVKHLAIAVAPYWREFADKEAIAKLLYDEIINLEPSMLNNPKPDVQRAYNNRFAQYMKSFLDLAAVSHGHYGTAEDCEATPLRALVLKALSILADAVKNTPIKEREIRANLKNRLKSTFDLIPYNGPRDNYPKSFEEELLAPFKGLGSLFAVDLLSRRVSQSLCASGWHIEATPLLHELFSYGVTYPSSLDSIINTVDRHMGTCASSYEPYRLYAHPTLDALLANNLSSTDKDMKANPKYRFLIHRTILKWIRKWPEYFVAHGTTVTDFLVNSFSFLETGDIKNTAPTSVDSFVNEIVDTVVNLFNGTSRSNGYGNRNIPSRFVVELLQRLLLLTFDANNSIAEPAKQVFFKLGTDNAQMVVEGLPQHLCYIIHLALVNHSEKRTSDSSSKATSIASRLLEAVEKRMEFEPRSDTFGHDPSDPRLTKPSIKIFSALVTNSLTAADPIGIPTEEEANTKASGELATKVKRLTAQPPAYQNVLFDVTSYLLSSNTTWATFLHSEPQLAKSFIHQGIVRATGYADQTPSVYGLARMLQFIRLAFDRSTTLSIIDGEENDISTKAVNDLNRAKVDKAVDVVAALINDILSLSLNESKSDGGLGLLLLAISDTVFSPKRRSSDHRSPFRHLSAQLALDVLLHFGEKTVLEIAKPAPQEEEKEKKPEGEEEKEKQVEEGEGEEEEAKKKETKKGKKAKPSVERVWRPTLVALLDKLSEDEDPSISQKAAFVVTRSVY